MASQEYKDAKLVVVTSSFSARAALYEHLFQFENSFSIEKSFASLEGKDVLVLACNNSYGLPSDSAREALKYALFIFFVYLSLPWSFESSQTPIEEILYSGVPFLCPLLTIVVYCHWSQ